MATLSLWIVRDILAGLASCGVQLPHHINLWASRGRNRDWGIWVLPGLAKCLAHGRCFRGVCERMKAWTPPSCCILSLWFSLERQLIFLLVHCSEYTSTHPCLYSICSNPHLSPSLQQLCDNSDLHWCLSSLWHPFFGTRTAYNKVLLSNCLMGLGLMAPCKQGVGSYLSNPHEG